MFSFPIFQGTNLAVATYRGRVLIWDVEATQCIRRLDGHVARVGALAWNGDLLASGSRDRQILLRDVRADPVSGGGPTASANPPSSATTAASAHLQTGGPYSLLSIDRELLSNSARGTFNGAVRPAFAQSATAATAGTTPGAGIGTDPGHSVPGAVRVLKDHKQEVRPESSLSVLPRRSQNSQKLT